MHCFEVRTANVDYLVGVDPSVGDPAPLPPPDSGVGAYLARSWETAIRHALMPVTHHSGMSLSNCLTASNKYILFIIFFLQFTVHRCFTIRCLACHKLTMCLLPAESTTACSSEQEGSSNRGTEMAQVYQIFPDEVLGSGQFGIVYGGLHRRTRRSVAIKVRPTRAYIIVTNTNSNTGCKVSK